MLKFPPKFRTRTASGKDVTSSGSSSPLFPPSLVCDIRRERQFFVFFFLLFFGVFETANCFFFLFFFFFFFSNSLSRGRS